MKPKVVRVRGGRRVAEPYEYHWRNMPEGTVRVVASPIDAVFEVLMHELKIPRLTDLLADLTISTSNVSRCRHRNMSIPHFWLLKASILSRIPYAVLCEIAEEEPEHLEHFRAKEWKP